MSGESHDLSEYSAKMRDKEMAEKEKSRVTYLDTATTEAAEKLK